MCPRSHGRLCLAAAACFVVSFLLLRSCYAVTAHSVQGINNSTLGFETILAINAPWRTDRKDSLLLASMQSGIKLEWIDGVNGSLIDDRAFPQGNHRQLPKGNLGSWRAHMDAIRLVIERNLSTALIIEDDIDWHPRIRSQLSSLAIASQRLPAMIAQADLAAHHHVPSRDSLDPQDPALDPIALAKRTTLVLPTTPLQSSQPYGMDWDILWLGHCSNSLPPISNTSSSSSYPTRFILPSDPTVPKSPPFTQTSYPPHSRLFTRAHSSLCTLAYAITQRSARKMLYEHGLRNFDRGYDFALGEWCDGTTKHMGNRPMCLSVSPGVFAHWYGKGGAGRSDIAGIGGVGVRASGVGRGVRGNLEEEREEEGV